MFAVLNQLPSIIFKQILRQRLLPSIAFLAPWIILRSVTGIAICLGLLLIEALWLWQQTKKHYVSWLDAQFPQLEDSTALLVQHDPNMTVTAPTSQIKHATTLAQLQRARLVSKISSLLTSEKLAQMGKHAVPWRPLFLVSSCLLAGIVYMLNPTQRPLLETAPINQSAAASVNRLPQLNIKITPPSYTNLPAYFSQEKPLQVPEHSQVAWCIENGEEGKNKSNKNKMTEVTKDTEVTEVTKTTNTANSANSVNSVNSTKTSSSINLSNGQEILFVEVGSTQCAYWDANETVFWTWSADPKQKRINLKVLLDQAPEITIKEPSELLQILATTTQTISMSVQVRDDYQVAAASMHLTLARGSGENVRFSDKEVPLPQSTDKRSRNWNKRWTLAELGMEAGDELYFFVRAIDNAGKNPHIVRSPTYTLRLPAPNAEEEEISVLPILAKAESLRSQRQIIIDTEQLLADIAVNPKVNAASAATRNRSEAIANDQAALRRRYGRFLGEESSLFGDEHDDKHDDKHESEQHDSHTQNGKQSNNPASDMVAQYGHAHDQAENATFFDEGTKKILRHALAAMWDAEKFLRAIAPKGALQPENKALEAIKQLQQADRIYLHKAAFTPPAIKEELRLTGDVIDVRNKQREQSVFEDTVSPQLRALLIALGKDTPLPALWTQDARAFIAKSLQNDTQRLQAQAAVQDVADGCQACRAQLAAWLRQGIAAETRLQAQPAYKAKTPSRFEQRWQEFKLQEKSQ